MNMKNLTKITELAKFIMKANLKSGDIAVDATMGNGHDTYFLAQVVGPEGKVFSFDIQEMAIINTKKMLEKENLKDLVTLIHDGHEKIDKYIFNEVDGVMFNLGYLPRGDHSIVTKPDTTILAIKKSLKLLKKNGVITIVIYWKHDGGLSEKNGVLEFVENLDQSKFHVVKMEYINQTNCPPLLITIFKK